MSLRRGAWVSLLVGLVGLGACGPTVILMDDGAGSAGDDTGTSTSTTTAGSVTLSTTRGPTTSTTTPGPVTLDGTTRGPDETGVTTVTTVPPPPPPDTGPMECELLGATCAESFACCTGACYISGPLGGVCSECEDQSDCRYGCTPGWPLDGTPAECGDGGPGSGCDSNAACVPGLLCNEVVEIPGILTHRSCGECIDDGDCPAGTECAPTYDVDVLYGSWRCVDPGSQPLTAGCGGDQECASGHCAVASLMGIPVLSVCSECNDDGDCGAGTCVLPEAVIDGIYVSIDPGYCA